MREITVGVLRYLWFFLFTLFQIKATVTLDTHTILFYVERIADSYRTHPCGKIKSSDLKTKISAVGISESYVYGFVLLLWPFAHTNSVKIIVSVTFLFNKHIFSMDYSHPNYGIGFGFSQSSCTVQNYSLGGMSNHAVYRRHRPRTWPSTWPKIRPAQSTMVGEWRPTGWSSTRITYFSGNIFTEINQ